LRLRGEKIACGLDDLRLVSQRLGRFSAQTQSGSPHTRANRRDAENAEVTQRKTIMGVAKLTDQNTIVPDSKYARVERERRYLLQDLPEGLTRTDPHLQITDNYLTGTRLRIRRVREPRTNTWTVKFTQKFPLQPDDLSRTVITNIYLNAIEAETLSVFNSNEIRKNRYYFNYEGRKFSVDMFLGDLFGLVLAEVSFETDEELSNFPKPSFALAEVTNQIAFSGGRLAELTFADVRQEITNHGLLKVSN
jgi:CYTH domain-containing protein